MNKDKLKLYCKEKGINKVGIAGIGPYHNLEKILKYRLQNGYITGMEEPVLANRVDPKLTMENVKSIIVVAIPYYIGNDNKEGNLSKYCYSKDYHIVVKELLQDVCNHLESEIKGFEYKIFTDNGPLVDRHLAYLSGVGYYGINNNIITDEYGSYVFIGYIMNNYEFAPDEPLPKTCIKCGKCVKYCPGNAILGNYEINPKRCLSYITQKKEELSEEEKNMLKNNNKVFGCDICQDICPHNKNIEVTNIDDFKTDILTSLEYEKINNLSNKEFKNLYREKAFSWRGKKIIKRNLAVVENKPEEN